MARPLMADVIDESAPMLLQQLRRDGFQLCVDGDRLRIRPAERLTPALRDALARCKPELLALLAPVSEHGRCTPGSRCPCRLCCSRWTLNVAGSASPSTATGNIKSKRRAHLAS